MRANSSFLPGLAVLATGVGLVASVFISPDFVWAGEPKAAKEPQTGVTTLEPFADPLGVQPQGSGGEQQSAAPSCSCPESREKAGKPKFAGLAEGQPVALDESDEIAALASVQQALNGVGDGSAYVWARANGRLSGLVRPISSFRNDEGQICRHVVVMLTTGARTQKTESTACRLAGGRWQLGG